VLTNARLHGDLARYAPSAELIVLPAANPGHIPPTDFGHADQLITQALAATRTALATGTPRPPMAGTVPPGCRPAGRGGQATLMAKTPGPSGSLPATAARGSRHRPGCCGAGLEACCPAGGHRGHRRLRGAGARHSAMTNFTCAAGGTEWRALGGFEEAGHGAEQAFGVEL
jgi:hypothetical protein